MAEYYYILASLPYLRFSDIPPLSAREFLELSIPWMGPRDSLQLELALIDIQDIPLTKIRELFLRKWVVFEHSIRNELVRIRAQRLGRAAVTFIRADIEEDPTVWSLVREAVTHKSPLVAELNLLKLRWDFLTEGEVGHYFDLAALVGYRLKLQLLERKTTFDEARGRRAWDTVLERSLGNERQRG